MRLHFVDIEPPKGDQYRIVERCQVGHLDLTKPYIDRIYVGDYGPHYSFKEERVLLKDLIRDAYLLSEEDSSEEAFWKSLL